MANTLQPLAKVRARKKTDKWMRRPKRLIKHRQNVKRRQLFSLSFTKQELGNISNI